LTRRIIACSTTWVSGSCSRPDVSWPGGAPATCCFRSEQNAGNDGMNKVIFSGPRVDALEAGYSGLIHNITEKCVSHFHSVQPAQGPNGLELAKARRCFLDSFCVFQSWCGDEPASKSPGLNEIAGAVARRAADGQRRSSQSVLAAYSAHDCFCNFSMNCVSSEPPRLLIY
jgi:hypothetical protein